MAAVMDSRWATSGGLCEHPDSPLAGVQIWIVNLDQIGAAERSELIAHLNLAEQARAASFRFLPDRQRFQLTRGLLRRLLGERLGRAPGSLVFEYGEQGKPALLRSSDEDVRFNLSHAGGWAIFALAVRREVGIDLETEAALGNDDELAPLAKRFLTSDEFESWSNARAPMDPRTELLRAWTRKEAYVKATGKGVFAELKTIQPSGLSKDCIVFDLQAPTGFAAALCIKKAEPMTGFEPVTC